MNEQRDRRGLDGNGDEMHDPVYVISIVSRMVGMHAQTLRQYERIGLIEPSRSRGNIRLYSQADVAKLRQVQRLINDLGVNLAGVEVILRLNERIRALEQENEMLRKELQRFRDRRLPAPRQ